MEPAPDPSPFAAATGHDGLEEGRPSSAASSAPGHTTPSALDRRHSSKSRDWPEILRQFSDPPVIGATLARPTSLKCSVSLAAWHTNPQVDVGPTGSTQNQDIVLEGSGLGSLLWLSASLSGTNLASFAIGLVGLAFIGRIGEAELAAAVLATILFNMTGLSFMQGLNAALETFCG